MGSVINNPDRGGPSGVKPRAIELSSYGVGRGGDDSALIARAIDDARARKIDHVWADVDINLSAPIVLGGASFACFLAATRDRPKVKITALPGYTGTLVSMLRGGISGFRLVGSDRNAVAHKGITIGDATNWNAGPTIRDIENGGGLYDCIFSEVENDTCVIEGVSSFEAVGRSVIWIETGGSYSPSASARYSRLHLSNPETAPVAGAKKKYGICLNRTENIVLDTVISNNFDFCIALGNTSKNWSPVIRNVHVEERRTSTGTNWTASNVVAAGAYRSPTKAKVNGRFYICTVAGTTGATEPVWPTTDNGTVVDGTATWAEVGASVGMHFGINENMEISSVWSDNHLIGVHSRQQTVLSVASSGNIGARHAAYLANDSLSVLTASACKFAGDVRTNNCAVSLACVTVSGDTVLDVPSVPVQRWTNRGDSHSKRTRIGPVTTNYTALATDDVILVDATAAALTVTLPAITDKEYTVYKYDDSANAVTVTVAGTFLESGVATHSLALRGSSVTVMIRSPTLAMKLNITV